MLGSFMHNSFPMREWHAEHMEKTILKYTKGLSADASSWEKRNQKKYGSFTNICRQVEYDIQHGVTNEELLGVIAKIRHHSSFRLLRKDADSMERLSKLEEHFTRPKAVVTPWSYRR